jgi:hypothetical protein
MLCHTARFFRHNNQVLYIKIYLEHIIELPSKSVIGLDVVHNHIRNCSGSSAFMYNFQCLYQKSRK